jgi:hypothetical protein
MTLLIENKTKIQAIGRSKKVIAHSNAMYLLLKNVLVAGKAEYYDRRK